MGGQQGEKTWIGVLASHDSPEKNNSLARLFEHLHDLHNNDKGANYLDNFGFLITGGTFDRVIKRSGSAHVTVTPVNGDTQNWLMDRAIRLPSHERGGVIILAYLVTQVKCSIVWPFLTLKTNHLLNPANLALLRLCDFWKVKVLMNRGSVEEWLEYEAKEDVKRNPQSLEKIVLRKGSGWEQTIKVKKDKNESGYLALQEPNLILNEKKKEEKNQWIKRSWEEKRYNEWTIALIAHDALKDRMLKFVTDYRDKLAKFGCILATGTTGGYVREAVPKLKDKIYLYDSGPKGGDIEIAIEVLYGHCQAVIFFIDPLYPHPHIEDIRTLLGACMLQDKTLIFTNEDQAREWMDRVIR